jgi:hypothetical protein
VAQDVDVWLQDAHRNLANGERTARTGVVKSPDTLGWPHGATPAAGALQPPRLGAQIAHSARLPEA